MKVLVAPASFGRVSSEPLDRLESAGFELVVNPYGRRLAADEVVALASDCLGIVSGLEPLTREVIASLPHLRCISRSGSGLDNVDLAAAAERGIAVRNTKEAPARAVAELTLGLALDLLRDISGHDRAVRAGEWRKRPGRLLEGCAVGVVGLGHIGREVARLFRLMGATLYGTDLAPDAGWARRAELELGTLPEILSASRILTIHVSRSAGDPPLIGRTELMTLPAGAFLLNLSRGEVVDEPSLLEALRSGHLGGAGLDVFGSEPYHGALRELPNVVLTPHIGSSTRETILRMESEAASNLIEALTGAPTSGGRSR